MTVDDNRLGWLCCWLLFVSLLSTEWRKIREQDGPEGKRDFYVEYYETPQISSSGNGDINSVGLKLLFRMYRSSPSLVFLLIWDILEVIWGAYMHIAHICAILSAFWQTHDILHLKSCEMYLGNLYAFWKSDTKNVEIWDDAKMWGLLWPLEIVGSEIVKIIFPYSKTYLSKLQNIFV